MSKKIRGEDVVEGLKKYGVTDCDITPTGILKGMCKEIEGVPVFFCTTFAFVLTSGNDEYVTWAGLEDYLANAKAKYEDIEKTEGFHKVFAFDMVSFDFDECETAEDCAEQPYIIYDDVVSFSYMGGVEMSDILGFMVYTYLFER